MSAGPLMPLVNQLKHCVSANTQITAKRLNATWSSFKSINPDNGDTITPAVMVGVILYDTDTFAPLLTQAEQEQLAALAQAALERYEQIAHPPNHIGKTIAATLKGEV